MKAHVNGTDSKGMNGEGVHSGGVDGNSVDGDGMNVTARAERCVV